MAGACRPRPSRRSAKTVFDDDLRSLQPVAPITEQRDGIPTAGPALEAAADRDWLETILPRMVAEAASGPANSLCSRG
jgi:hypothetical protein